MSSHSVRFTVTDELGIKTIIDTEDMGDKDPLGDHLMVAISRVKAAFSAELGQSIDRVTEKMNELNQIIQTVRTILDQPTQDPDLIDTGLLDGHPVHSTVKQPIDDTITKLTDAFIADPTTDVESMPGTFETDEPVGVTIDEVSRFNRDRQEGTITD